MFKALFLSFLKAFFRGGRTGLNLRRSDACFFKRPYKTEAPTDTGDSNPILSRLP